MVRSIVLGAIIGGIIAFVWEGISWMALPWHCKSFKKIRNEEFVGWVVKENARKDGIYIIPNMSCDRDEAGTAKWKAAAERGPYIFASVATKGITTNMTGSLVTAFVMNVALAGLITFLVCQAVGLAYWGKVGLVTIIGLIAGVAGNIPMWNWFAFPANFTLINLADTIITWFFAGLGIAFFVGNRKRARR